VLDKGAARRNAMLRPHSSEALYLPTDPVTRRLVSTEAGMKVHTYGTVQRGRSAWR